MERGQTTPMWPSKRNENALNNGNEGGGRLECCCSVQPLWIGVIFLKRVLTQPKSTDSSGSHTHTAHSHRLRWKSKNGLVTSHHRPAMCRRTIGSNNGNSNRMEPLHWVNVSRPPYSACVDGAAGSWVFESNREHLLRHFSCGQAQLSECESFKCRHSETIPKDYGERSSICLHENCQLHLPPWPLLLHILSISSAALARNQSKTTAERETLGEWGQA